ncbi:MAG: oxidoreductase [Sphingobacteriia bacterium]|nr:oxidoreductase [Sphingobacteriia bacterium]
MEKKALSLNSLKVSGIILGMWRLADWKMSRQELYAFLRKAVDRGFSTFDHADIYGDYTCEDIFGQAISVSPSFRSSIEIVTKCGIKLVSNNRPENSFHGYDTSRVHIIRSVERSLKNFRTDYLDLLLIHRPDPIMNVDEIADAFYQLKKDGKVLHFGVSNFLPHQFDLLRSRLDFQLVTNQVEVSVLATEAFFNGVLDQCQLQKICPMAWSPLGGGRLFHDDTPQMDRLRFEMNRIADETGCESLQNIALAWLLKHPSGIIPVLGTGNLSRILQAEKSLQIQLSTDQWFRILTASQGHEVS